MNNAKAPADTDERVELAGRVALVTQGVLYVVVGILAVRLAIGDSDEEASQQGAIEAVARQPFGRILLVVLVVGLAAHALWRIALAVRGEPGDDEDGGSMAKRLANGGRAAIYVGFTAAAVRTLTRDSGGGAGGSASGGSGSGSGSGGGSGSGQEKGTAEVLGWPGGPWIVAAVGLAVIGAGIWNIRKTFTRSFVEHLDLYGRSEGQRRAVELLGAAGYAARGIVFGLIGWFLVQAGITHDPDRQRTLDETLREVAEADHGPLLLGVLAVGLFLFGVFRIIDGLLRLPRDITYS